MQIPLKIHISYLSSVVTTSSAKYISKLLWVLWKTLENSSWLTTSEIRLSVTYESSLVLHSLPVVLPLTWLYKQTYRSIQQPEEASNALALHASAIT